MVSAIEQRNKDVNKDVCHSGFRSYSTEIRNAQIRALIFYNLCLFLKGLVIFLCQPVHIPDNIVIGYKWSD